MADAAPAVPISENSLEEAALKLLEMLALSEIKRLQGLAGPATGDRKWLLNTYSECLDGIRGKRICARDMR